VELGITDGENGEENDVVTIYGHYSYINHRNIRRNQYLSQYTSKLWTGVRATAIFPVQPSARHAFCLRGISKVRPKATAEQTRTTVIIDGGHVTETSIPTG
jgi:hypothetical protein